MASFVLGAALRDLRRGGAAAVVAILLSGLAALATGGTLLGLEALARLAAQWRADLRVVAILRQPLKRPEDPQSAVSLARALPGVGAVRYVSADEALADLRRYLGAGTDGLDRLSANPVPARFEVIPQASLDARGLRGLLEAIGRLAGVEEVQAAITWVEQVERLERGCRIAGLAVASLLGLGAFLAVAAATRAARQGRAEETAVLRLCGAREGWIWSPLLLQALFQGGAGAVLGVTALVLFSEAGAPWFGGWLRTVVGMAPLPMPPWPLGAALLGGGLMVGLAGGLGAGRP